MARPNHPSTSDTLSEPVPGALDFPRAWWARLVLTAVPPLVALASALAFGPYLVDDAYITFRYAANLAAGHGLVFNPGEAVLGTTTPLLAGLLGVLRLLGADIPSAARVLGLLGIMGVVLIIQRLALKPLGSIGAAAVALCLALHPDLAFAANSGMETGLSMAAVYGALLLTLRGWYFWAGLAAGIAFLLRPDGAVLIALLAGFTFWRAPRLCWRALLGAAVVSAPWLAYAYHTYGAIAPHSITAKQLIHAELPLEILRLNVERLTASFEMMVLSPLALLGLILSGLRRSGLLLVGVWMLVYLAGLSATCITPIPFPWYLSPLFPGIILFAGYATFSIASFVVGKLARAAERPANASPRSGPAPIAAFSNHRAGLVTAAVLLFLAGTGHAARDTWRRSMYDDHFGQRTAAYLAIADLLRPQCAPGDVLFVGEVGALAFALPEQVILDSSGINSPAVLRARRADFERLSAIGAASREGSVEWVAAVVDEFAPRYLVTYRLWMHIRDLASVPHIQRQYQMLELPDYPGYIVLERLPDVRPNTDKESASSPPDNVVSGVYKMHFAGYAAREVAQQVQAGLTDLFRLDITGQRRLGRIVPQHFGEAAYRGAGERPHRTGRQGVDSNLLLAAQFAGQIAHG